MHQAPSVLNLCRCFPGFWRENVTRSRRFPAPSRRTISLDSVLSVPAIAFELCLPTRGDRLARVLLCVTALPISTARTPAP
jgi:hypothetical protein